MSSGPRDQPFVTSEMEIEVNHKLNEWVSMLEVVIERRRGDVFDLKGLKNAI